MANSTTEATNSKMYLNGVTVKREFTPKDTDVKMANIEIDIMDGDASKKAYANVPSDKVISHKNNSKSVAFESGDNLDLKIATGEKDANGKAVYEDRTMSAADVIESRNAAAAKNKEAAKSEAAKDGVSAPNKSNTLFLNDVRITKEYTKQLDDNKSKQMVQVAAPVMIDDKKTTAWFDVNAKQRVEMPSKFNDNVRNNIRFQPDRDIHVRIPTDQKGENGKTVYETRKMTTTELVDARNACKEYDEKNKANNKENKTVEATSETKATKAPEAPASQPAEVAAVETPAETPKKASKSKADKVNESKQSASVDTSATYDDLPDIDFENAYFEG